MADSLILGGLELLSGQGGTYHIIDGQRGFGDPQAVTEVVRSQLGNGSSVSGDFTDNRPVSLQILIVATSRLGLTLAHDALLTQMNQRFNTLAWTPNGGYRLTFDTFKGQPATQWSGKVEALFARVVGFTCWALPFGRSDTKVTITGQSSSIQLGFFNQATQYPYKTVTHGLSAPGIRPDLGFYQEPAVAVTGNAYAPQTVPAPIDGQSGTMRLDADFYTFGGSGPYTYYQMEAQIPTQPVNPKVSVAGVGAQVSSAATALAVPYPVSPNSPTPQQILILSVSSPTAGAATVTTPPGWTVLQAETGAAGKPSLYTFWKKSLGTESGTLAVTTSSATPTWNATIFSLNAARLSSTPYAHVAGAVSSSTVTTVTTSSLTVDTTAPQGDRFTIAIVQGTVVTSNNWSAESWASLTGVTGAEVQDLLGTLIYSASATGGSASTFAAASASTNGYAYVVFDIVEAQTVDLSANQTLTLAVYVGSAGNVPTPYFDSVAAWLTLVDGSAATQSFYMSGPAPNQVGYNASAGWQYLTCSLAGAAINLATIKTWQLDLNNPTTSYALPAGPNAYFLGMLRAYSGSASLVQTLNGTVLKIPGVAGSAQAPASIVINPNGGSSPNPNLLPAADASLETGLGSWTGLAGCTVAQTTAQALDGSNSLQITATSTAFTASNAAVAVQPNTTYTAVARFRAATTPRTLQVSIRWQDASHTVITDSGGTFTADTTSGWTQVSVTALSPANAAYGLLFLNCNATVSTEVHYADEIDLHTGFGTAYTPPTPAPLLTAALVYRAPAGTPITTPIMVAAVSGAATTGAPSTFFGTYRVIVASASDIHASAGYSMTIAQKVNGATVASITTALAVAEGINFLDCGDVTLPLVDIPADVSNVTYTATYPGSVGTEILFLDTRGFLVWIPQFAAANVMWIDEATVQGAGGVYAGASSIRTDAVSLLGGAGAQANGAMSLDPGDNYLLTYTPGAGNPPVSVGYMARFLGERTAA